MADELHISSIVVHVRPEAVADAARSIEAVPGAEIHQRLAGGKLIVTLETGNTGDIMQHIERINDLPGVVSTALVYHHWEPEAESEADHEAHPPQVSQG
jgi:periplasmic nitrate reductase NapD